jgi:ZIP family zinc transporter
MSSSQWMPLYLSSLAGASTCLGAAIVFLHPKQKNIGVPPSTMSFSLALAGSVMITVSVLSLGPECLRDPLAAGEDYKIMPLWSRAFVERLVSFLLGCCLYRLLSYFAFPEPDELVLKLGPAPTQDDMQLDSDSHHASKHHPQHAELTIRSRRPSTLSPPFSTSLLQLDSATSFDETEQIPQQEQEKLSTMSSTVSDWSSGRDLESGEQRRAWRVAMLLFISLLIHNFPEGLAVAVSAMESTKLGVTVAFGIMIHNIPEGIAIAVPCLAARPDKPWMAFLLASGSGLAEPLGAAVALLFLRNQSTFPLENVLAFVAGIMIMVALCELFPEAKRHDRPRYFTTGTLTGIAIMGMTELYLP